MRFGAGGDAEKATSREIVGGGVTSSRIIDIVKLHRCGT